MSLCKGCGAEIRWVKMESGASMPIDPKAQKVIQHLGYGKHRMIEAFTPHWATCPEAARFKKEKEGS